MGVELCGSPSTSEPSPQPSPRVQGEGERAGRRIGRSILFTLLCVLTAPLVSSGQATAPADLAWPPVTVITKPWTRWWWPGSAVDKDNISRQLAEFNQAGIGGIEITPIYGVHGAESRNIDFLSPAYMDMLRFTATQAKTLGMKTDMAIGTGWPMGGPTIQPADADTKLTFGNRDLLVAEPTNMKVKRAAPGGEGLVLDPYSTDALAHYLSRFDTAFKGFPDDLIDAQFHDSFEYMGNWDAAFPAAFLALNRYNIATHAAELNGAGDPQTVIRVKSDYRQTLAKLHLDFIKAFNAWCHTHNWLSREQAHGSPTNLLDAYAATDIPETEIFGGQQFPIPGYRHEALDIDPARPGARPLITRFASSAAHVAGKPLASSGTFTWLRDHFRAGLPDMKPEADELFVNGINRIIFHGSCYSPADAIWPGWNFYASVEFNDRNTLWHDLPAMVQYLTRCQSVLQRGTPDNDLLLYFPVYDLWANPDGLNINFATNQTWMDKTPFAKTAQELIDRGYAFDYISDAQIQSAAVKDADIALPGGSYKAIVVPPCVHIPLETMQKLRDFAMAGATVIFADALPSDVPGLSDLQQRLSQLKLLEVQLPIQQGQAGMSVARVGSGMFMIAAGASDALNSIHFRRETMSDDGIRFVRRSDGDQTWYFITNLTGTALDKAVTLATPFSSALVMDPLTGRTGAAAPVPGSSNAVDLQLAPGQSVILRLGNQPAAPNAATWPVYASAGPAVPITGPWQITFLEGGPNLPATIATPTAKSWTDLGGPDTKAFAGTARYSVDFDRPAGDAANYMVDLGDVRESARVALNGQSLGTIWSLPFKMPISATALKPGRNHLDIEVTNLAANRIRDLDVNKVNWKIMYDANIVGIGYQPLDASKWPIVPSGLLGPITLTPLK